MQYLLWHRAPRCGKQPHANQGPITAPFSSPLLPRRGGFGGQSDEARLIWDDDCSLGFISELRRIVSFHGCSQAPGLLDYRPFPQLSKGAPGQVDCSGLYRHCEPASARLSERAEPLALPLRQTFHLQDNTRESTEVIKARFLAALAAALAKQVCQRPRLNKQSTAQRHGQAFQLGAHCVATRWCRPMRWPRSRLANRGSEELPREDGPCTVSRCWKREHDVELRRRGTPMLVPAGQWDLSLVLARC